MFLVGRKHALGIYKSETTRRAILFGNIADVHSVLNLMRGVDLGIAAYESHNSRKVAFFSSQYQQSLGPQVRPGNLQVPVHYPSYTRRASS